MDSFDFYRTALLNSFLFLIFGTVFSVAFFFQIMSVVVTNPENTNLTSPALRLLLAFLLSTIAVIIVKKLKDIEPISQEIGGQRTAETNQEWPGNLLSAILLILIILFMGWATLEFSKVAAQEPLSKSFHHAINKGEVLQLIANSVVYLTLASSISAVTSGVMIFRYMLYPWSKGGRAWIRRCLFFLSKELGDYDDQETNGICPQCCNDKFEICTKDGNRVLLCSFCGLKKGDL